MSSSPPHLNDSQGDVHNAAVIPVAFQLPDRLRWWRQHRLREQPIPEGHYILNGAYYNYTTFGTRPLSQHLLKDLRNARLALAHHDQCQHLGLRSSPTQVSPAHVSSRTEATWLESRVVGEQEGEQTASSLPDSVLSDANKRGINLTATTSAAAAAATGTVGHRDDRGARLHIHPQSPQSPAEDTAEESGSRGRASRPPTRHLHPDERVALERFVQLFRPRPASVPPGLISRRPLNASSTATATAPSHHFNLNRRHCGGSHRSVDVLAEADASQRVLVLHNPPRLVLHTKGMPSDAMLHAARVSRADREHNVRLLDRPDMLELSLFPLLPYERDFYTAQLRTGGYAARGSGHSSTDDHDGAPLPPSLAAATANSPPTSPPPPAASVTRPDWDASSIDSATSGVPGLSPLLLPCGGSRSRGGGVRRPARVRRAASQPALPLLWTTELLLARSRSGLPSSPTTAPRRRRTRPSGASPGVLSPEEDSSHLCRRLADLQDAYIFNPLVDGVGQGAFSQVYAAVPFSTSRAGTDASEVFPRVPDRHAGGGAASGCAGDEGPTAAATKLSRRLDAVPVVALKIIARKGKAHDERRQRARTGTKVTGAGGGQAVAATATSDGEDSEDELHGERKQGKDGSLRDGSQRRELVEVEREISVLRQLKHTGCSIYYEALRTPDAFVIAMKLNKGSMDTRQFLSRFGPPSEARSALLVYQLVETIHYLHDIFGVLHRDIKLENVLVSLVESVPLERVTEILGPQIYKDTNTPVTRHTTFHAAAAALGPHLDDRARRQDEKGLADAPAASPATPAVARLPSRAFAAEGTRSLGRTTVDTAALFLRATLIDFGLARRIHAAPTHRQTSTNGAGNSCTGSSGPVTVAGGRRGMPTPLPSTANMFTGFWEVEEESGASSTDVSASQTEEDEDDAETALLQFGLTSGLEEDSRRDASLTNPHAASATTPPPSASTPLSAPLPSRRPSLATNSSAKAHSVAPFSRPPLSSGGHPQLHARTGVLSQGTPATTAVHRSASMPEQLFTAAAASERTLPALGSSSQTSSLRPSNATTPMANRSAVGARRSQSRTGGATSTTAASTAAAGLPHPNVAEEASTILLTPCGTERYLAPEMLDWIIQHGWARRPTSVKLAKQMDMYAVGVMTYVLLSGSFPCNGTTRATLAQQQKRVPRCSSERWRGVSANAVSFVQALLDPDPERRLSAEDALKHPFLREAAYWATKLHLVPGPISATTGEANGSSDCHAEEEETDMNGCASTCAVPGSDLSAPHATVTPCEGPLRSLNVARRGLDSSMDVDTLVDQLLSHSLEASPTRRPVSASASAALDATREVHEATTPPIDAQGSTATRATVVSASVSPSPPLAAVRVTSTTPTDLSVLQTTLVSRDGAALEEDPTADPSPSAAAAAVIAPRMSPSIPAAAAGSKSKSQSNGDDDDDLFDALYNDIMSAD